MATYRLFPNTQGPSSAISYSGNFTTGVVFEVTTDDCWLEGYWWWVAGNGPTAAQKFALWLVTNTGSGVVIPAATVTSGTLSPGWNFVPLPAPIPLSVGGFQEVGGACYVVATGVNGNFPETDGYFTTGGPAAAGITNGPLTAFSDQSGSLPAPFAMSQAVFSVAGTDPAVSMPAEGHQSANFWMDLQVSDSAPVGYAGSYRLWPNFVNPTNGIQPSNDTGTQTTGNIFSLSQPCHARQHLALQPRWCRRRPHQHTDLGHRHQGARGAYQPDRQLVGLRWNRVDRQQLQRVEHHPAGGHVHRHRLQRQPRSASMSRPGATSAPTTAFLGRPPRA